MVTAARGVAGATARLVSASRAKADPMSTAQQKLSGAAKTVANATSDLVQAAKAVGEIEAEEPAFDISDKSKHGAMTEKFQTYVIRLFTLFLLSRLTILVSEVEIMQLEKKLAAMQRHLVGLNKAEYQTPTTSTAQAPRPTQAGKPAPRALPQGTKPAGVATPPPRASPSGDGPKPAAPRASQSPASAPPAPGAQVKRPAPPASASNAQSSASGPQIPARPLKPVAKKLPPPPPPLDQ